MENINLNNNVIRNNIDDNEIDIKELINELIKSAIQENENELLFWNKEYLTLTQASRYTGIGVTNLRKYVDSKEGLVLYVGKKRLIRKGCLLNELANEYSI